MSEWNPKYVAYASASGRTPEQQMEADREEFPGGGMVGFILWMSARRQEFCQEKGLKAENGWTQMEAFNFYLCSHQQEHLEFLTRRASELRGVGDGSERLEA